MFQRTWAAIVAGVAGAAVGLVAAILLLQFGYSLDNALMAVWILAGLGAAIGLVTGGRKAA
jgi:uncharacterized membrane protein